jgi:transketolase
MRTAFIQTIIERSKDDTSIFIITPDMGFSVFEPFIELFPDRFLNVGIAEQNAISVAAGLALSGYKPYVYSIIPFAVMRCFEQIRVDVAYMNTNVKIVGVGGGLAYGPAGATHHAIEDIGIMRCLPNMTVCAPGDPIEARQIIAESINRPGPMYIRLAKNNEPEIHCKGDSISIGNASVVKSGCDFTVITDGSILSNVNDWVKNWNEDHIFPELVSFHTIKPLDTNYIDLLAKKNKPVLIVEEHNKFGGLGEAICAYVGEKGYSFPIHVMAIQDTYSHFVGTHQYLLNKFGLLNAPSLKDIRVKIE